MPVFVAASPWVRVPVAVSFVAVFDAPVPCVVPVAVACVGGRAGVVVVVAAARAAVAVVVVGIAVVARTAVAVGDDLVVGAGRVT